MRNKCESLETRRLGALELPLNYAHTDECWKLSLEQRVYKQGRGYYYIDETGRKYQFEEEYFYQQ